MVFWSYSLHYYDKLSNLYIMVTLGKWPADGYTCIQGDCLVQVFFQLYWKVMNNAFMGK